MGVEELITESKAPTSRRNHVGIEIECIINGVDTIALEMALVRKNLQWNVNVGEDGSIDEDGDDGWEPVYKWVQGPFGPQQILSNPRPYRNVVGVELRILAEEKEAPSIIKETCEVLSKFNAQVNSSCGLHVHLDMRNRDYKKVYSNLFMYQDILFKTQPKSRYNNRYCKKLPRAFKSDNVERYYAINKAAYHEHRTLEVRLHEGTVNANAIKMWTYLLIKIANMKEVVTSKQSDFNMLDLPKQVMEYFDGRLNKHSSVRSA